MIERLLQFIEFKGVSKSAFYNKIGVSNGFLDRKKDIGSSKIEKILFEFPEINPEWLLTGEGVMLKPKNSDKSIENINNMQSLDTDVIKRISYIKDTFFDGNNSKFADFVGTSEANIRNYCKSIVPRTEFLIALATKLEINFDWLMLGKGQIKNLSPTSYFNFNDPDDCDYLKYLIELQKSIIEEQKNEIVKLKKELNKSLKK